MYIYFLCQYLLIYVFILQPTQLCKLVTTAITSVNVWNISKQLHMLLLFYNFVLTTRQCSLLCEIK